MGKLTSCHLPFFNTLPLEWRSHKPAGAPPAQKQMPERPEWSRTASLRIRQQKRRQSSSRWNLISEFNSEVIGHKANISLHSRNTSPWQQTNAPVHKTSRKPVCFPRTEKRLNFSDSPQKVNTGFARPVPEGARRRTERLAFHLPIFSEVYPSRY